MKKKLIAAILSVALVASLLPATAFATETSQAVTKTNTTKQQSAGQTKAVQTGLKVDNATLTDDASAPLASRLQISVGAGTSVSTTTTYPVTLSDYIPYAGTTKKNIVKFLVSPVYDGECKYWTINGGDKTAGATATDITTGTGNELIPPAAVTFDELETSSGEQTLTIKYYDNATVGSATKTRTEVFKFTPATANLATANIQLATEFIVAAEALPAKGTIALDPDDINDETDSIKAVEAARKTLKALQDEPTAFPVFTARTDIDPNALIKTTNDRYVELQKLYADEAVTRIAKIPTKAGGITKGQPSDADTASNKAIKDAKTAIDLVETGYKDEITNKADYDLALKIRDFANEIDGLTDSDTATPKKLTTAIVDADTKGQVQVAINTLEGSTEWNDLTSAQRQRAANWNVYDTAKENVARYDTDVAAVKAVVEKMNKTMTDKIKTEAQVEAALALQKEAEAVAKKVTNKDILKATTGYNDVKAKFDKAVTDADAYLEDNKEAQEIIALIKAIPSPATLADMAKVDAASTRLAASNAEVKALVAESGYRSTLTKAESSMKDIINSTSTAAYTSAFIKAYIEVLPATITDADLDAVALANAAYSANKGKIDASNADWSNATRKLSDATVQAKLINEKNQTVATKFVDKVNEINSASLTFKEDVKAARALYENLTAAQKKVAGVPASLTKLKEYEAEIATSGDVDADETLAVEIIAAIKGLPRDTKDLAKADQDVVYAIAAKYKDANQATKEAVVTGLASVQLKINGDILTPTNAANFQKYLDAAVSTMDTLVAADVTTAIKALVPIKVDATIEEIVAANTAVKAARDAYDKLTADQKKKVTNLEDLTKAETALSAAKVAHTDANLTEIAKIDFEKELTAEQLTLIKHEKDCVAALTDAEIAKLNADNLKIFNDKALPALEASEEAATSLEGAKVEGLKNFVYNGKAHTPAIKVTDKAGKEIAAENYTVKYYSNKNVGEASVVVKAKKDSGYTGETEATFVITPAKAAIASLQVAKAKLRVNIKPMSNVNYRIAYKLTSAASSSYKGQNTSLTSKVLPGIKAKKKYTVKLRAYVKVNGKTYFGAYSPIKHATTK